jgi:AbiU2
MDAAKVLADIVQSTIGAKTHWDMWWAQAHHARLDYKEQLAEHSDFFDATYDAHYMAYFVYLAHLFDKRADSSSIARYFALMGSTTEIPWDRDLECRFAALSERAKPLLVARHKTVAHIDAICTEKDVFNQFTITWNEVHSLTNEIVDLVTALRKASHPGEIGIPRSHRLTEATINLLESLKNQVK